MGNARQDLNGSLEMFAQLLEGTGVEFKDDFDAQAFLLETVPAMVDAIVNEDREEVRALLRLNDPNNATKLRELV